MIIVDAIERQASPGTVVVLVPEVPEITEPTLEEWRAQIADLHLAEPSRLFRLARAGGVLPERVLIVGCQPETCEEFEEGLTPHVAAAIPVVTCRVQKLVDELLLELR